MGLPTRENKHLTSEKHMFNKVLVGAMILVLPIAIIGSYKLAKSQIPTAAPSSYDNLVDNNQPKPVATDPLNPNSKAEVIIDAPKEAKVGQLVRFDLTKSSGTMFMWKVLPSTTNFEVYEGGRKAVFSTDVAGDYTFIIAVALNGSVDVKTHTIKVGNGAAPVVVPPTPLPIPTSTLAAKVTSWADAVASSTKKSEAVKLADSFLTVANLIKAPGGLSTPEEIIAKTAATNRTALGAQISAWVPFLTNLQAEMKTRSETGLLVTAEQHAAMWIEISIALRTYGG